MPLFILAAAMILVVGYAFALPLLGVVFFVLLFLPEMSEGWTTAWVIGLYALWVLGFGLDYALRLWKTYRGTS